MEADKAQEIRRMFLKAIDRASENSNKKTATEGGVKYSSKEDSDSIKEQIKSNLDKLNKMNVVATIYEKVKFTDSKSLLNWVMDRLKNTGYKISRQNYGDIVLDEKRIKNGLRYLKTDAEKIAFTAVPSVIKKGIEIGRHSNHKGRQYNTVTFAAPIEINGYRGNMAVTVREEAKNYYKVHRVLTPDGSVFEIQNTKGTVERAGGAEKNSSGLSPTDSTSINNISDNSENVNTENIKYSLKGDFSKEDIENNKVKVANMSSVVTLKGSEFKKGDLDLTTQVSRYFDSIGNVVHSKYGDIILNKAGVKSSIAHGIGRNKAVAFKAVKDVISKGNVIDYQNNWKGRGYDTAVIAAPISIDNEQYLMAAVIRVEKENNSYYLHEIVMKNKEDNAAFKTGTIGKDRTPSATSSSVYSLLQDLINVNTQKIKRSLKDDEDVDIKYSKKYNKGDNAFSKALTAEEWIKYNSAITTGVDAGLRINDHSMLVECESGDYSYKLVIYDNTFEEKPIQAVYGIGNNDYSNTTIHKTAKVIAKWEDEGYGRSFIEQGLRHYAEMHGIVLGKYSEQTSRYSKFRTGNIGSRANTQKQSFGGTVSSGTQKIGKQSLKDNTDVETSSIIDTSSPRYILSEALKGTTLNAAERENIEKYQQNIEELDRLHMQ